MNPLLKNFLPHLGFALAIVSMHAQTETKAAASSTSAPNANAPLPDANEAFRQLRAIERELIPADVQTDPVKSAAWGVAHTQRLRPAALECYTRFPQDRRRWQAVLDYAFGMQFSGGRDYLERVRKLLREAADASDIEPKIWEQAMATRIEDLIYTASVLQAEGIAVHCGAIAQPLERLAQRAPDSRFRPLVELAYVDLLNKTDSTAAQARLTALGKDTNPQLGSLALGKLRMLRLGDQPLEMQFTALDGRQVDLTKLRGKIVLVDFWATWCAPCVQELPNLQKVYAQCHARGFEVVGISLDRDGGKSTVLDFMRAHEISWPQYFDGKGWQTEFALRCGVDQIPAAFLLDREGKLIDPDARGEKLATEVEKLLGP